MLAFRHALCRHKAYLAAAHEAELVELARQKQKRSYWERLDAYAFETATAEVLELHGFRAEVTRGSGDRGVDIHVRRDSHYGVVQCKARASSVGPHTVRDLYGTMHDFGADFGVVVSLNGFSEGAVSFAVNKPVFLVDVDDLVKMQQGSDVLGPELAALRR